MQAKSNPHDAPLLAWVVQCYGHCVPRGQTLTGPQFAAAIRSVYETGAEGAGPINDTAARIAERLPGRVTHTPCLIRYEQP